MFNDFQKDWIWFFLLWIKTGHRLLWVGSIGFSRHPGKEEVDRYWIFFNTWILFFYQLTSGRKDIWDVQYEQLN